MEVFISNTVASDNFVTDSTVINSSNTMVYPKVSGLSHNEINNNNNNNKQSLRGNTKGYGCKTY
jgi:hypothetical protein